MDYVDGKGGSYIRPNQNAGQRLVHRTAQLDGLPEPGPISTGAENDDAPAASPEVAGGGDNDPSPPQ